MRNKSQDKVVIMVSYSLFSFYVMCAVVCWLHLRLPLTSAFHFLFQSYVLGMFYKDVQTINSSQLAGEETGASYNSQSYSPKPPTQAGAMSDRQALRVHQIRERGKQMDEKYLTEVVLNC